MTKKLFATILATFILAACGAQNLEQKNESDRAEEVENENYLGLIYENKEAGIAFEFADDYTLDGNLFVRIDAINELGEQPLNFTTTVAENNRDALANGEFGEEIDWPLEESKRVKNLGELNAQDFVVFSRFEICSVVFERKLIFYANDRQIVLTLVGDRDAIIEENPEFFETNTENCGEEKIWNFEKQADFYEKLVRGDGSPSAQKWFNHFDATTATLEIFEPTILDDAII